MPNFWKDLKKPVIGLAPMYGVTDHPMRQIQALVAKPSVIYTEFVRTEFLLAKPEKAKELLRFEGKQRPIVVQVYGSKPENFYLAVKKLVPFGFSGIDINMGCPRPSATKVGGGAALIGNFNLAEKIIKNCLKAIRESGKNIPLSVKTRIRREDEENKEWFSFLSQFPLAVIAVHGRLFSQGLSGLVDWQKVEQAGNIVRPKEIIFLGNGAIKSLSEARKLIKKHKLNGVLIGRAVIGNPWIFKGAAPKFSQVAKIMIKHCRLAEDFYQRGAFPMILKHLHAYPKSFKGARKLRAKLMGTKNVLDVEMVLKKHLIKHDDPPVGRAGRHF